jgi:hypothetical protein
MLGMPAGFTNEFENLQLRRVPLRSASGIAQAWVAPCSRSQSASGFRYGYSVYQAEYSRNLLFASGGQMEDLFNRMLERTRSRLDIPAVPAIFGLKTWPHRSRAARPPAQEVVIEKPQSGLAWFRMSFGMLQVHARHQGPARPALRSHRPQRQGGARPRHPHIPQRRRIDNILSNGMNPSWLGPCADAESRRVMDSTEFT